MLKLLRSPDKILKYFIASILIIIPLFPKFPFVRIPGSYVSARIEDFILLILTAMTFVFILPKLRNFLSDKIVRAILLFLGVGLVSLLSGILVTKTVALPVGILHWLRRIEYFIPFFAGMVFVAREKKGWLEFMIKVLMITVLISFIYGLGQKYLNFPVIITQNEEYSKGVALRWIPGSHVNSTFAGHYDLATFLVLILPIFITLFFILRGKWTRASLLTVVFSGLWLLVNAVSRISIVSYLLGVTLALLLAQKHKVIPLVLVTSILFFSFSSDLVSRYLRVIEVYGKTTEPTPAPVAVFEDRSTSIRLNVEWPRAIRSFSKNPIVGTGYSSIGLASDNDYLRLLAETGILGFLAFLLFFVRITEVLVKAFPLPKNFTGVELGFISGIIGGLTGTFLNAFFIDVFEASKFAITLFLLLGLTVSLARTSLNEY